MLEKAPIFKLVAIFVYNVAGGEAINLALAEWKPSTAHLLRDYAGS